MISDVLVMHLAVQAILLTVASSYQFLCGFLICRHSVICRIRAVHPA